MTRCFTIAAALVMFTASGALAQSASRSAHVFLDGGGVADAGPVGYADLSVVPGLVAAVGASFTNRWTVRFETTVPAWHKESYDCCGGISSSRSQHRMITYGVLAGRTYPVGARVGFTPLAGFSVVDFVDHGEFTFTTRDGAGTRTTSMRYSRHEPMSALVLGADTPIVVSARVTIVPQIRLHVAPNYESVAGVLRPAVAVRIGL